MQDIVAPFNHLRFDLESALESQLGLQTLPFQGMDKSGSAICTYFLANICSKGMACPYRHIKGDRTVVCKHWLRGLCKKGDDCEFLHEYDLSKMPECYFFSKFGECNNRECPFLHIDPSAKIKDCPWYDRGFCRHGPKCKNRHVRRVLCQCYLQGFCLDGPKCKYMHPRFDLPTHDPVAQAKKASIVCHFCGEAGHKAVNCAKIKNDDQGTKPVTIQRLQTIGKQQDRSNNQMSDTREMDRSDSDPRRPLDQVTCFKCGEKGHYANKCPKGHLAFLSAGH